MQYLKKSINNISMVILATLLLIAVSGFVLLLDREKMPFVDEDGERLEQIESGFVLTEADQMTTGENLERVLLDEYVDGFCIKEAGSYYLTGTLGGQLQIDAQEQIVHLILDNVLIESSSGSAMVVHSAGKVILTLQEGSINSIRDSATYPTGAKEDACIYSACDMTVNGKGRLNVSGYYEDAIHTKDVLKIIDADVFVQAKRDGLHGNDGIYITGATLSVESERHGLNSTKTGNVPKGNIEILGSECSVIAGGYAISSSADLYVYDCNLYAIGVYDAFNVKGTSYIDEGVPVGE